MASPQAELLGGGASQYKTTNQSARLGEEAILKAGQNTFFLRFLVRGLHTCTCYCFYALNTVSVHATVSYISITFAIVTLGAVFEAILLH